MNLNDLQDKVIEKAFWDGQSDNSQYKTFEKKVYSAFRVTEYIEMLRLVNEKYPIHSKSFIVDIGCSAGVSSITLSSLGFHVTGLDISEGLITQAKQLAKQEGSGANFLTGDASRLPFEDESVDICFMVGLLHHFPNYLPVISDIHRVLKSGGLIVAVEPNAMNLSYRLSFELVRLKKGVTENEHPLSPSQIRREFSKIYESVSILPFRVKDVPFLRQLGWLGRGLSGHIIRNFCLLIRRVFIPKIFRGTFFIAVGKKK
jgi:ubiquinone/menaquinone biosynthesis C-methylase UbiE